LKKQLSSGLEVLGLPSIKSFEKDNANWFSPSKKTMTVCEKKEMMQS